MLVLVKSSVLLDRRRNTFSKCQNFYLTENQTWEIYQKYSIIDIELVPHSLPHSLIVHILEVYLLGYQPIFYSSQMSKFLESLKNMLKILRKKFSKRLSKVKSDQSSGEYFRNVFKMPLTIAALAIAWPNLETTINKYENWPLPKMNALIPVILINHSKKFANQEAILFSFFESTLFFKLTIRAC